MSTIFEYTEYRKYLKAHFSKMPKQGYGQSRKLAEYLGIHTTLVSHILTGVKTLTPEQAALAAEFLGLSKLESECFLLLVQMDRAGNQQLKGMLEAQLVALKIRAGELANRLHSNSSLSENDRARFYSHWSYSAIRQMPAIKKYSNAESIASALGLELKETKEALEFLISAGLCTSDQGQIKIAAKSTHLERSSPWARVQLKNWRLKAMESLDSSNLKSLHYSGPMTLSKRDAEKIRERLVQVLQEVDQIVEPSPSEELCCLNIDWFNVSQSI